MPAFSGLAAGAFAPEVIRNGLLAAMGGVSAHRVPVVQQIARVEALALYLLDSQEVAAVENRSPCHRRHGWERTNVKGDLQTCQALLTARKK
jgi:hypothetical protein